ncbi:hypothetical protein DQ384_05390 [Sphaerisporangium album]|uniref:ADP ribosyltransferase domain-containing protein n=1 Tax=Sphaerisporangium album TaxID=509200 RepID=A0A367FQI9_9ACTN|nr:ADP-ribosyltransferase [Sphaerisporangium album]RCG31977.1 hypothetical protein DQ384_05390 [Sphaerisporangium album]
MSDRRLLAAAASAHPRPEYPLILEHLPGRHDQKTHGRSGRGNRPESKGDSSAAERTAAPPRRGSASSGGSKAGARAARAAPVKDKRWLDAHYGEWRNSLSPTQDKAMRFYQSPGFALVNGQLRGLKKGEIKADVSFTDADLERARKASTALKSAIKKAPPLVEPMTVYRGFGANQFGDLEPGQVLSDKGFVSTSITPDVGAVGKATKQATAEITLPEGTKAAAGSARELVLPPGSKFRVLDVSDRSGVPHVRMELIL